ncbi:MAG: purine nucleoside phosphorylase DeoD-type, partial [Clostridia bacterium]
NIPIVVGDTVCSECFDYYVDNLDRFIGDFPKELNIIGAEMEAFALFYTAKYLGKKAACLLTVVDNHYKNEQVSSEAREKSLNNMITLALDSALKL